MPSTTQLESRPKLAIDVDHTITDGAQIRPEMVQLLATLAQSHELTVYTDRAPKHEPNFDAEFAVLKDIFTDPERGIVRLQLHTADQALSRHLNKLRDYVEKYLRTTHLERIAQQQLSEMDFLLALYQAFGVKYPLAIGAHIMLDDLADHINSGWETILSLAPELSHMAPVIIDARRQVDEDGKAEDVHTWEARMHQELAAAFQVVEYRLANATHTNHFPSPLLTRES